MKTTFKILNLTFALFLIISACALAYVTLPFFGNKALVVRSGSMMPSIGIGDLLVVRANQGFESPLGAVAKYKVGEIIAFKSGESIVTHRTTEVKIEDGKVLYATKGDANKTEDKLLVWEKNVIGAKYLILPNAGRIVSFAKGNVGLLLLIVFPAFFVILFETVAIYKELKRHKIASRINLPSAVNLTNLKVLLPIFATIFVFQSTFAYFSDSETSTGNIFTASSSFGSPSPLPSPSPSASPSPTPPPIAQTLVINEVLADTICTIGQQEAQWIEVYNGFSTSVNLKNFQLTDGTNTIDLVTANTIVPAGGFALISHSNATWTQCFDDNDVITANLGGQLNIDTGFLQLLDVNSIVIDTVQWGGITGLNPTQNQSIERDPDGLDSATGVNFNAADFVVRATVQPGL